MDGVEVPSYQLLEKLKGTREVHFSCKDFTAFMVRVAQSVEQYNSKVGHLSDKSVTMFGDTPDAVKGIGEFSAGGLQKIQ